MTNNVATNNQIKTAVIYARYSSSSQTEQSIEGQLDVCNKFAKDNNLQIVGTYIDRAMTGTNDNRPDFQKMLKDSEKAKWDVVLVYAIDRFGRNSIEIAINKQKLLSTNKVLISATQKTSENLDGTKNLDGIILENVYIGIAEYYSAELSQKVLRGQRENRKKGLFCGGCIPYGYYVKDKKVYIDETESQVVKYIFEQYTLGKYVVDIIADLTKKGILRDGKPFKADCVNKLLRNTKYIGIYINKDEVYDNIYPRIISDELFEKAAKRRAKNQSNGHRDPKHLYLLRYKLRCGYCGETIQADVGHNKYGSKHYYYTCRGKKVLKNGCAKMSIRQEVLEKMVIDAIIETISNDELLDKMVDSIYEVQEENLHNKTEYNVLTTEHKQLENSLKNIMKAIENGMDYNLMTARINEINTRLKELDVILLREKNIRNITVTKDEIKTFFKKAVELEPLMLIESVVKQITLYDDKMIIKFNNPTRVSPDESQGFSFCLKEQTFRFRNNNIKYKLIRPMTIFIAT